MASFLKRLLCWTAINRTLTTSTVALLPGATLAVAAAITQMFANSRPGQTNHMRIIATSFSGSNNNTKP